MYNWNQKYSCLKDLNWLSLDVEQHYSRRTPPEAPTLQDCAINKWFSEETQEKTQQELGITSGSGGIHKECVVNSLYLPYAPYSGLKAKQTPSDILFWSMQLGSSH